MKAIQARSSYPLFSIGLPQARSAVRILYHLARADLFERTRRYSFLITVGLLLFVAYLYLPPADAGYLTMGMGNYRGVYNSAWIGGAMGLLCSVLLSLPAFYLVKNAIERDERTRVGQILATTPLSRPLYALGKALSNFVFLAVAVGVIALGGLAMQFIRAEVWEIDLWALAAPFLFAVLPGMAVIAALALLFETISWLRGTAGNVLYFFVWLGTMIVSVSQVPRPQQVAAPGNDLWGVAIIATAMVRDTAAAFPGYSGLFSIGLAFLPAPLQTFVWEGVRWTPEIILGRLLWFGVAIGLSLIAAFFFRRFDPSPLKAVAVRAPVGFGQPEATGRSEGENHLEPVLQPVPVQLSPLAARYSPRLTALLAAELRVMCKRLRWWWYLIALGLIVAGLLVSADVARYLLLATWLWPLPLWSALGTREIRYRSGALVFSAPRLLLRQLPILWLSGCLVAVLTGSGVAVSFVRAGEWTHLLAWGTGAAFIPALALALGVWSSNRKLFEVVYMMLWYAGPVNSVPALDFMGAGAKVDTTGLASFWIATAVLLALAAVGRRHLARMG